MTSSQSSNRPSWIGHTLGERYRVDEILGQGGMSAVYKAFDPNLRRVVAVKMIHSHLADDPRFLIRFEEEAAAVAQLRHPNIVQVFDFNHDGDLYYMVQEFLAGETLQARLQRLERSGRRMPFQEVIGYTLNLCAAIGYAHKRGMIHRDVKPANIMLDVQRQAILMDFGIVKITGGERHTATGAVVGTALYMPPEVIRGEIPDPRSDIYSVGVTLFEMVSGRPPFKADSAMSLMMMHLHDPVPDLRRIRPEVPRDLIAVIEKSLAKDRDDRYSSAEEMAAALTAVLERLQATASPDAEMVVPPFSPGAVPTQIESGPRPPLATPDGVPAVPLSPAETPTLLENGTVAGAVSLRAATSMGDLSQADQVLSVLPRGAASGGGTADMGSPSSSGAVGMPASRAGIPILWIVVIVAGIIAVLGGITILNLIGGDDGGIPAVVARQSETAQTSPALAAAATAEPSATQKPTSTRTATPTVTPTATLSPTPTRSPTPTIPVGVPFSRINGITIDDQLRYIVDYETFEYTETLPGMHVHFFFNSVPPEQAGNPGRGPWVLWGGPRPFDRYRSADRPKLATQMCILVANPNHSVQPESGNCMILPDVTVATANIDLACRAGPGLQYPEAAMLTAGQVVPVLGISPDESWWNVAKPENDEETCWLDRNTTTFSGDIATLPMAEPPPLPAALSITITRITVDDQNRYVVEYTTQGFTEQLPGTHMHFFFDTVPLEQVGESGSSSRLMHGGPVPFTRYSTADRPPEAAQICVLVANPDHSIIPGSGNCFALPDAP